MTEQCCDTVYDCAVCLSGLRAETHVEIPSNKSQLGPNELAYLQPDSLKIKTKINVKRKSLIGLILFLCKGSCCLKL